MNDFQLRSRSSKKSLGKLTRIIADGKTCPFCDLVVASITNENDLASHFYEATSDAVCFVNWEIDGRAAACGPDGRIKGRTRRLHLSWSEPCLIDSYLVFAAPHRYFRPNSDAQYVWGNEALFLGRDMHIEGGNRARIKSWLDLCCESHRGPNSPCKESRTVKRDSKFGRMISQSYFGVIDVRNLQLTSLPYETHHSTIFEAPDDPSESGYSSPHVVEQGSRVQTINHAPYVALSHVWGKARPSTTTLENVMRHRNHGGLETLLADLPEPHVFRDAIDIVRGLGIQYIWIDSLCIVQNSSRSWNLNARVMDLIYGNAWVTICAADGEDTLSGLRAMHPKAHDDHQYIRECVPGVRLMVSRPPETGIRASAWNRRAWTFQERLLSKRCLIFTEGRVYFQCLSTGMSEDIVADKQGAGWSLDLVQAPLQMLRELDRRAFWVYSKFVSLYTARHLTKPRDILAAFDGICNLMRKTMRAPFIFGLPSSHFDMALLWEPNKALKRRKQQHRKPSARSEEDDEDYNDMEFPSWAWCGWIGEQMEYQPGMVEGCTDNLHEWLMKHTWIYWYIRDGHGNLRPLWDGGKSLEDKSSEKRWTGYKTTNSEGDDRRRRTRSRSRRQASPSPPRYEEYRERDQDWKDGLIIKPRSWSPPGSNAGREIIVRERSSREVIPNQIYEGEERIINRKAPRLQRDCDEYGRLMRPEIAHYRKDCFRQTLPENPYRVVMANYSPEPDKEFPDQPILQFWTWHTSLHLVPSDNAHSSPGQGLCRYDIADEIGDWCGSLVLDQQWIEQAPVGKHEFIAISEAKSFTREECDVWTYYIPKEREQSEWDLYYVLLVERKDIYWERVAVGKVFKTAFGEAKWKEIILG